MTNTQETMKNKLGNLSVQYIKDLGTETAASLVNKAYRIAIDILEGRKTNEENTPVIILSCVHSMLTTVGFYKPVASQINARNAAVIAARGAKTKN